MRSRICAARSASSRTSPRRISISATRCATPATLKAAAGCYDRVLQLQPGAAEAHFRLADLHAAEARHDEAVAGYERALALKAITRRTQCAR